MDPALNDDGSVWLLPPNDGRPNGLYPTDNMCHPSQTIGNYTAQYPMLTATPGDFIVLRYQENGHVTLPEINPTKPKGSGTVYVYGTNQPSSQEKFLDVWKQWTADGQGGNKKGRLLATRNFDDKQCYQINGGTISQQRQVKFKKVAEAPQGADLWCQTDIQLPGDVEVGKDYTLYWVWHWPTFNVVGQTSDIPSGNSKIV